MLFVYLALVMFAANAEAVCWDKYNDRYHNTGSRFTRVQPMRNSDLKGTYSCICRAGGFLHCSAVDIPCYDFRRKTYVPKEERFFAQLIGKDHICICRGGRGRFDSCHPSDGEGGCHDQQTGRNVGVGESYVTERYGAKVRCVCAEGGIAARSSCRYIGCRDSTTDQTVSIGSEYTIMSFGSSYICTCGTNGRPVARSCRSSMATNPCESATCHALAVCRRRGNAYDCVCTTGYEGNGKSCEDVDECSQQNACDENASCTNTQGSYSCTCNEGYSGNGFECTEQVIDHCSENSVFCSITARCVSTSTSFKCICFEGYSGDGTTCPDIDECANEDHRCDPNASCENTEGSYMCFCNVGFSGDGRTCRQMCEDESTGHFIDPHHLFIKIKNGRKVPCTCGENGEELEGSCAEEGEPVTSTTAVTTIPTSPTTSTTTTAAVTSADTRCRDDATGEYVESGQRFTKREGRIETTCLCRDGKAATGSCRNKSKLTSNTGRCKIGRNYYAVGDTFTYSRGSISYNCRCRINYRGAATSMCSHLRSARN